MTVEDGGLDEDLETENDNATFSHDTVLHDGQTVSQWGFDESGLQAYLEGTRSAYSANNLTIIPEPTSFILVLIGLALLPLRVQR